MQRGQAELDGEGVAVGGIAVMRYGENALEVIDKVKQRLEEIKPGLPEGVEIVPVYDRSILINEAVDTLTSTLIKEILIVSLIIGVFLLHVRSTLVAAITLPVAVLMSFIPMYFQGLTVNIMSLGGIAVAIGAMLDAAIVIIDNIHKRLARWESDDADPEEKAKSRQDVIIEAMQQVGPSIFSRWRLSPSPLCRCSYWRAQKGACSSLWLLPRPIPWHLRRSCPSLWCRPSRYG